MKKKIFLCVLVMFVLAFFLGVSQLVTAQDKNICINRDLCVKMIRLGEEAYWRGRYLDAKQYFKKAIQADPTSEKAWRYYDLATIYALAEKVEKNLNLVAPDVSTRQEVSSSTSKSSQVETPQNVPVPQKNEEFVIVDDEGC